MARFYPLYVRRSDGKLEVLAKGKRKEPNQPTEEQLDQKPDKNGVSDYYREVAPDEAKHLDWRRKLGGMLAREMDWKDNNAQLGNENGYMLVTFPESYRLYEHVKKTEKDGKTEVRSKTHAAGGNDRQDAYLYGHPEGRKKRYRSPADFFPHLLWLCTDESGDTENCGCKICSPEDLDDSAPSTKTKMKQEPEFKLAGAHGGAGTAKQGHTKVKQEPSTPIQPSRPTSAPQPLNPTPLTQPKTSDQAIDRQYHTFMYRQGELVWFQRGQAWGLGAILRRWVTTSNQYHYSVQPLSHPYAHPEPVIKSSDAELRPWLAWSVPKYTNDGLNNLAEPPKYESVDWQGMMEKQYGQGDMEVDGSILAAKMVDSSYTPFGPNRTTEPEPGVTETHYDGIFLGAEKIWVGDPLRLQTGSGTDILVLHDVIERKRTVPPNQQQPVQAHISLLGDIYQIQRASHTNPNVLSPASPSNNPQLPPRLTEDLVYRNARSIAMKKLVSFWKLTSALTQIEVNDVKGRWYEASLLLPILQQAIFEDSARKGEIQEASLWMNARGDSVNSNRPPTAPKIPRQNIRKQGRREAFGGAMPPNAEIRDGIEPPLPDNVDPALSQSSMEIDPRFDTAENNSSDEIRVARPGDDHEGSNIDEFMNLDVIEDQSVSNPQQMPGFGQEHDSQGQSQGFY